MIGAGRAAALTLLLLLPLAAAGQVPYFGEAVPLTDTRYGAFSAEPRLTTNGRDFFLFWATDSKLRVTRLVDGEKRAGRPVLDVDNRWFDVVWTGTHFLVVGFDLRPDNAAEIRGRIVDANGDAVGDSFPIATGFGQPQLAFDGARVMLLYRPGPNVVSLFLRPDGTPAADPHPHTIASGTSIEDTAVAAGGPAFVAATAFPDHVRVTVFHSTDTVANVDFPAPVVPGRRVSIAGNGSETLIVWTNGTGVAHSARVRAGGAILAPTAIAGTEGSISADVSWNGSKWALTTTANGAMHSRLIDTSDVAQVLATSPAHAASPLSVASANGRTLAAWLGAGSGSPLLVRDLAVAGNGGPAAFAAAEQTLQTTAWSHDAALTVWSELRDGRRTLHAGVRTTSGSWRESRIGDTEDAPLAASDGSLFLVIRKSSEGWSAVTLDPEAKFAAASPLVTTFTPTDIAWDGNAWVVIGVSAQSNIYAVRVMPWGAVSAPVLINERRSGRTLENARIAYGGGGFLAVWQDSEWIACMPVCDFYDSVVHGARLTADLGRVDTTNLDFAPDEALSPDLYWNGSRFVLFWLEDGALKTRTMRPNASGSGMTSVNGVEIGTAEIRVIETPFGAAIHSHDGEVLVVREGILVSRHTLGTRGSADSLANLGSGIAYVQAATPDQMPYHGSSRLFLRVGSVVPPAQVPSSPRIVRASMTDGGNLMAVDWNAPLEPVNGYRLEYRVNEGTWNELDAWFDATVTEASIRPWLENAQYEFRVRAWSDAGVSAYSAPMTVRLMGRRRSVR